MKNSLSRYFAIAAALVCGCSESDANYYDDAQCDVISSTVRIDSDEAGTMGLSAAEAAAAWEVAGVATLIGASPWFNDRSVDALITLTPTGEASEVEQAWGDGEQLDPSGCPAMVLRVPVSITADVDTVGTASGVSTLVLLQDGTPHAFDEVAVSDSYALAAELESGRNTTCSDVGFTLSLGKEGWFVFYGADCEDATGGGLLADLMPEL